MRPGFESRTRNVGLAAAKTRVSLAGLEPAIFPGLCVCFPAAEPYVPNNKGLPLFFPRPGA